MEFLKLTSSTRERWAHTARPVAGRTCCMICPHCVDIRGRKWLLGPWACGPSAHAQRALRSCSTGYINGYENPPKHRNSSIHAACSPFFDPPPPTTRPKPDMLRPFSWAREAQCWRGSGGNANTGAPAFGPFSASEPALPVSNLCLCGGRPLHHPQDPCGFGGDGLR
jgi:hypothetical protein